MICWLKTKQNIKMCIWTKEIEFFQGHLQQMFAVINIEELQHIHFVSVCEVLDGEVERSNV